jgi:hypothetical protein
MKSLRDYIFEKLDIDNIDILPLPEEYEDTYLAVFWDKIRTVAEDRSIGWTRYNSISEPIKKYVNKNRQVPVITKFGTGKKLPCADIIKFLSCLLANIKVKDAPKPEDLQKKLQEIFDEIGLTEMTISSGELDEVLGYNQNGYRNSKGEKHWSYVAQRAADGFRFQWDTGTITVKI